MAMAGLGGVDEIWAAPFHFYVSLRNDYLAVLAPPEEEVEQRRQIAPGTTLEVVKRRAR